MRIGIDIRPLQAGSRYRGIGYYIYNLVESMLSIDIENEYYLFYMKNDTPIEFKASENHHLCPMDATKVSTYDEVSAEINGKIRSYKIDIFVNSSPFEWDFKMSREYECRSAAILYDLIPLVFYNQYFKFFPEFRKIEYFAVMQSLRNYDLLLAISESSRADACEFLDISQSRVEVISAGVSKNFKPMGVDVNAVKKKFSIKNDFMMCTGGFDYRKNLEGLIRAFGLFCKADASHDLVIVCRLQKAEEAYLLQIGKDAEVPEGRLILTNFVTDEDLLSLYNAAKCVVFPSKYEGFGLPVIEGMACGKAVITSDVSSMPEVAGDCGLLIDPNSDRAICDAMHKLLSDDGLRKTLEERSLERAKSFGWERVASRTLKALESLYQKSRLPSDILSGKEKRLRLAYFTPLQPQKSGISDYSEELLRHLVSYADIDIFIDDYVPANDRVKSACPVYSYRDFERMAGTTAYDMIVYQMGNSLYHKYMYGLLDRYPGIVVLHDFSLHAMVRAAAYVDNDLQFYVDEMKFCHGSAGENEAIKNIKAGHEPDVYNLKFPANRRALYKSRGIIVHSDWTRQMVRLYSGGVPVEKIHHGVELSHGRPDPGATRQARAALGVREGGVLFASFGYVAETKRTAQSIRAFSRLLKDRPDSKYVFVGELSDLIKKEVLSLLEDEDLKRSVTITGYVPEDQFYKYLDAADICINLRYPTAGESSGSMMRAIGAGKPLIVSRIGSFKEFPDDFCWKVDVDESEEEVLYEFMKKLSTDKGLRESMGKAARKYAEDNLSYAKAAESYARFISIIRSAPASDSLFPGLRS